MLSLLDRERILREPRGDVASKFRVSGGAATIEGARRRRAGTVVHSAPGRDLPSLTESGSCSTAARSRPNSRWVGGAAIVEEAGFAEQESRSCSGDAERDARRCPSRNRSRSAGTADGGEFGKARRRVDAARLTVERSRSVERRRIASGGRRGDRD